MTDTNQASELFELCKEVYNRTGWFNDESGKCVWNNQLADVNLQNASWARESGYEHYAPLYTSDYLLEKLPKRIDNDEVNWLDIYHEADPDCWRAGYEYAKNDKWGDSYDVVADTPLKALLKLTIALSEAGELK